MCALFHFQTSGKDHRNYNLLWQTGSQSKQVPPTFKATNSCPPTTLPKTSKQSCSGAQVFPNPAACWFALQVLEGKQAWHRAHSKTQVKAIPREEEIRERRRGQGHRDPQCSPFALMHLRVDAILSSDFTPRNTTYKASQG